MNDWQTFFSDRAFHACLSNAAVLMVEKAFREARDVDVISDDVYELIWADLSDKVNKDLTVTLRCFYNKYDLNFDPQGWRSVNALSICRVVQNKLENSNKREQLQKIRSLGWRVREAEPLFKLLKEARNIAAHDFRNRSATGWSALIPATVLRVLEICPHPKNENAPVTKITAECEAQLRRVLGEHLSVQVNGSDEPNSSAGAQKSAGKDANSIAKSLDRIEQMLTQTSVAVDARVRDDDSSLVPEAQSDELDLPDIDWITPIMLKQELLALKQECASQFSQDVELGPKHNFFQKAMIADVMSFQPSFAAEVLRLPDFGWRYKENISSLGRQFKFFETRIDELLKRVDWD